MMLSDGQHSKPQTLFVLDIRTAIPADGTWMPR
jgi:hypothetical protein